MKEIIGIIAQLLAICALLFVLATVGRSEAINNIKLNEVDTVRVVSMTASRQPISKIMIRDIHNEVAKRHSEEKHSDKSNIGGLAIVAVMFACAIGSLNRRY